jgi:hypothetical protein
MNLMRLKRTSLTSTWMNEISGAWKGGNSDNRRLDHGGRNQANFARVNEGPWWAPFVVKSTTKSRSRTLRRSGSYNADAPPPRFLDPTLPAPT